LCVCCWLLLCERVTRHCHFLNQLGLGLKEIWLVGLSFICKANRYGIHWHLSLYLTDVSRCWLLCYTFSGNCYRGVRLLLLCKKLFVFLFS
jgi:hypothetical protein